MAKDPAFLFFPGDWQGGTATFSRHLKGCYMELLIAQFNAGPLSLEEIKTVLGSDFGPAWPTLQKKFKQTDTCLFFNERLEVEKSKRAAFSQSRRENVSKRYDKPTHVGTSVEHMNVHMEDRNRNEVKDRKRKSAEKPKTELHYPFSSPAFMEAWAMQVQQPKWKKKLDHALQLSLNKLAKYPEKWAIEIINDCIAAGWAGFVTDKYDKLLLQNNGLTKTNHIDTANDRNAAARDILSVQ